MRTHPLWTPFELPSAEAIDAARVDGQAAERRRIAVVPPDPAWPLTFQQVGERIRTALGARVLDLQHVGSTSVPELWAKPVIDITLTVADSAAEHAWLPDLLAAGFTLRIREPEWQEHRMLCLEDPQVNLHVFSAHALEPQRHVWFRDWLRCHQADRARYAAAKRRAAAAGHTDVMQYNNEKAGCVYDIYERIFAADPAHPHDPHPRPTAD